VKVFLFTFIQMAWVAGFSQSLSLSPNFGDSFHSLNLDIRWEATNVLPHTVWIYKILPKEFPSIGVSNLVAECGFTEQNISESNSAMLSYSIAGKFGIKHPDKHLQISKGDIFYTSAINYIRLATNVPTMDQMLEVTSNFLVRIGFNISEIQTNTDGTPTFRFIEPSTEYFLPNGTIITNAHFREARFGRSVDGIDVVGTAGCGDVQFGEFGKPVQIDISWHNLQRFKSYSIASPDKIGKWIREGKAVQQGIPMNLPPIDWSTVKRLTIKDSKLLYYGGERVAPSEWLMPLVSLWTTVDTGHGNIDVEIDCPIVE